MARWWPSTPLDSMKFSWMCRRSQFIKRFAGKSLNKIHSNLDDFGERSLTGLRYKKNFLKKVVFIGSIKSSINREWLDMSKLYLDYPIWKILTLRRPKKIHSNFLPLRSCYKSDKMHCWKISRQFFCWIIDWRTVTFQLPVFDSFFDPLSCS